MTIDVSTGPFDAERTVLSPYVPRLVIDWLATEPATVWREVDGTVAFVDISRFTKLSERLATHGTVGAEELSDTINRCFVELLAVAYARTEGACSSSAATHLLLLFHGDRPRGRGPVEPPSGCGVPCATSARLTVLGHQVWLRMSVGIHSGAFHFFLVGDSHRELIVTGLAASTTVAMEATAEAGEILVSTVHRRSPPRPSVLGAHQGGACCCAGRLPGSRRHTLTDPVASGRGGRSLRRHLPGHSRICRSPACRNRNTGVRPSPSSTSTAPTPSSSLPGPTRLVLLDELLSGVLREAAQRQDVRRSWEPTSIGTAARSSSPPVLPRRRVKTNIACSSSCARFPMLTFVTNCPCGSG